MKTRRCLVVASMFGLVCAGSLLGGCAGSTNTSRTNVGHIRGNLTPELRTGAQNRDEVHNSLAIMTNQHFRMMREDFGRTLMYVDRPTRLTPYPVAH